MPALIVPWDVKFDFGDLVRDYLLLAVVGDVVLGDLLATPDGDLLVGGSWEILCTT